MRSPHHPGIIDLGGGAWQVECLGCRNDHSSDSRSESESHCSDRLTAERLVETTTGTGSGRACPHGVCRSPQLAQTHRLRTL